MSGNIDIIGSLAKYIQAEMPDDLTMGGNFFRTEHPEDVEDSTVIYDTIIEQSDGEVHRLEFVFETRDQSPQKARGLVVRSTSKFLEMSHSDMVRDFYVVRMILDEGPMTSETYIVKGKKIFSSAASFICFYEDKDT